MCPIDEVGAGKFAIVRRGIGKVIIRGNEDERHFFHRGDVHSFVGRAGLHAAFADHRQSDEFFFAFHLFGEQFSDDDRDHRPKVTDHGELPGLGITAVNVAVAPAHRTLARAEIRARDVEERLAKCRPCRLIADEWRHHIALLQKQAARRAYRFLAAPDVNATGDHAAAVKTGQFVLENSRLQHPAKRFQVALVWRGFGGGGCAGTFRGLQHRRI